MIKGFRDFLLRGNVVDLAIAVVIGAAFTGLVTAFTDNFVKPLIAAIGPSDVGGGLGFSLRHNSPAAEVSTFIGIGNFITVAVNFVIVAAVVYFAVVIPMNKLLEMRRRNEIPEVTATPEDIALLQEIRDLLRERPLR